MNAKLIGSGGVWPTENPATLEPNKVQRGLSMIHFGGSYQTYPGASLKGTASGNGGIIGFANHFKDSGAIENYRWDHDNLWEWNGTPTDDWVVEWETYTRNTVSGTAAAVITGNAGTDWATRDATTGTRVFAGDLYYLDADGVGAAIEILTVDSDTQLTLVSSYVGGSSGAYTILKKIQGGATDYSVWTQFENDLYFANASETLKYMQGSGGSLLSRTPTGSGVAADIPSARGITTFAERIFAWGIGNYSRVTPTPRTLAWCANAAPGDWTITPGSNFRDFFELPGAIQWVERLDENLILYQEFGIWVGTRTGLAEPPVSFEPKVTSLRHGMLGYRSLVHMEDVGHVYIGQDNFYLFRLFRAEAVGGNAVRDFFYDQLNRDEQLKVQGLLMDDIHMAAWLVPLSGETDPTNIILYDYQRDVFYGPIRLLDTPMVSMGHFVQPTGDFTTIDDLVGTIDDQTFVLGSITVGARSRVPIYGRTNGRAVIKDGVETFDGTFRQPSMRTATVHTNVPGEMSVNTRVTLVYRQPQVATGTNVTVKLSDNDFATTLQEETIMLDADSAGKTTKAYFDFIVAAERIAAEISALDDPSSLELLELSIEVSDSGIETTVAP